MRLLDSRAKGRLGMTRMEGLLDCVNGGVGDDAELARVVCGMAYPCPQCGDRYTQSLPMVYGTGTSVRDWRSRSGYGGQTTSQTLVAGMATPPVKRSWMWPLVWVLMLLSVFVALQEGVRAQQEVATQVQVPTMSRRAPVQRRNGVMRAPVVGHASALTSAQWEQVGWVMDVTLWVGVLAGTAVLLRAVWFNRRVYPEDLAAWSSSFLCRGCGTVFRP